MLSFCSSWSASASPFGCRSPSRRHNTDRTSRDKVGLPVTLAYFSMSKRWISAPSWRTAFTLVRIRNKRLLRTFHALSSFYAETREFRPCAHNTTPTSAPEKVHCLIPQWNWWDRLERKHCWALRKIEIQPENGLMERQGNEKSIRIGVGTKLVQVHPRR